MRQPMFPPRHGRPRYCPEKGGTRVCACSWSHNPAQTEAHLASSHPGRARAYSHSPSKDAATVWEEFMEGKHTRSIDLPHHTLALTLCSCCNEAAGHYSITCITQENILWMSDFWLEQKQETLQFVLPSFGLGVFNISQLTGIFLNLL